MLCVRGKLACQSNLFETSPVQVKGRLPLWHPVSKSLHAAIFSPPVDLEARLESAGDVLGMLNSTDVGQRGDELCVHFQLLKSASGGMAG